MIVHYCIDKRHEQFGCDDCPECATRPVQKFASYHLYRYTGRDTPDKPEGFSENPSLVEYLNHLAQKGLRVFQVVTTEDDMWYTIITVEEE